uniref:DisA/LigA helix-hairpin-helix motif domain-containing protein n=1 Tax=Erpetoichthys calabaricus TaxID=27687 RepID=A0A8C4RZP6_ERPCA
MVCFKFASKGIYSGTSVHERLSTRTNWFTTKNFAKLLPRFTTTHSVYEQASFPFGLYIFSLSLCISCAASKRERARHTHTGSARDRQTHTDRQRKRETRTHTGSTRERDVHTHRQHEKETDAHTQALEESKEHYHNSFLSKCCRSVLEPDILGLIQKIPGVGKVKALALLQQFPSIQQLSNARTEELEAIVGQTIAQQIKIFFMNI